MGSTCNAVEMRFDHHSAVNGTGIAMLTRRLSKVRSAGKEVRIAGLSENFRTIFDMLGITRIAPCVDIATDADGCIEGRFTGV